MSSSQPPPCLLSRRYSSPDILNSPSGTAITVSKDPFHSLINDISKILEESPDCSDLTFKDINPLYELLRSYTSSPFDWSRYAYEDPSKIYTKNLIIDGDGRFNVTLQVWNSSKPSPITSHASHSITKILQGNLKVTRYALPSLPTHQIVNTIWSATSVAKSSVSYADGLGDETAKKEYKREEKALKKVGERICTRDEVIYMTPSFPGKEEMWKFENMRDGEVVVTLHLNMPLDPSTESYKVYDEQTGRKRHATQDAYHSKFGNKVTDTLLLELPSRMLED